MSSFRQIRWATRLHYWSASQTALVLLWLFLVFPSAFLNHLFPLDLGGVFDRSVQFPRDLHWILSPYNGSGRYFPVYWLYHAVLFRIFSTDVTGYFIAQSFIFLLSALILGNLFESVTSRGAVGMFFSVALFMSSPNAETLYTIGKAEPLVLFLISVLLFLVYKGALDGPRPPVLSCLSIALLFALSVWSKETSLILFAFGIIGMLLSFFSERGSYLPAGDKGMFRRYTRLVFSLAVGFIISKVPYWIFWTEAAGNKTPYTTFLITAKLVGDNLFFYLTQQPDVAGFGVAGSVLLFIAARQAVSSPGKVTPKEVSDLIFVISLLTMGWLYAAVFIVWRWPMGYYLFLPALIFRFGAGFGLYTTFRLNFANFRIRTACLVSTGLMLMYAAIYLWYAAASQVTYSEVYTAAIRKYLSLSRSGDSLIFESFPFYAEQVSSTELVLDVAFHSKRHLYGIADLVNPAVVTGEMRDVLSVSGTELHANEKNWPGRGDYVVAFTGDMLATWQIRGVAPLYSDTSDLRKDGGYEMKMLAEARQYFPAAFFNVLTHRIDFRNNYAGYEIYQIISGPRFTWLGKYPDGWIGPTARLTIYPAYVGRVSVHVSTSKYNSGNRLTVYEGSAVVRRAILLEGKEQIFDLKARDGDRPTEFKFEVDRTFIPKKLHMNEDNRELGALVRLEPFAPKIKMTHRRPPGSHRDLTLF